MGLSAELQQFLELLAPCAESYRCLKAVYVFGSIARGDAHIGSDVDLAFDFIDDLTRDNEAMESFNQFQHHLAGRKNFLPESWGGQFHYTGSYRLQGRRRGVSCDPRSGSLSNGQT